MGTCLNDEWEVNDDHVCQPKPEHFNLQCDANGMSLEVSNKLFPAAIYLRKSSSLDSYRNIIPVNASTNITSLSESNRNSGHDA